MPNIPDGHPHPFILLLVALMILTPFAGAELRLPDSYPARDALCDSIMDASILQRLHYDTEALRESNLQLLKQFPDEDWALRSLYNNRTVEIGSGVALEEIRARKLGGLPSEALGDAAWKLLEAFALTDRYERDSAVRLLEELALERPDWPWVHVTLFGTRLYQPWVDDTVLQAHMDACAGNAKAMEGVLERMLHFFATLSQEPLTRNLNDYIDGFPLGRSFAAKYDAVRLGLDIRFSDMNIDAVEDRWQRLEAKHGDMAWLHADAFCFEISVIFPEPEVFEFYNRRCQEGDKAFDFRLRLSELHSITRNDLEAKRQLEMVRQNWNQVFDYWIRLALISASGSELDELRRYCELNFAADIRIWETASIYRTLGLDDEWQNRCTAMDRHDPMTLVQQRIQVMMLDNPKKARALIDSVLVTKSSIPRLHRDSNYLNIIEAGDLEALANPLDRVHQTLGRNMLLAWLRKTGEVEAIGSFIDDYLSGDIQRFASLNQMHGAALEIGDESRARRIEDRMFELNKTPGSTELVVYDRLWRFSGCEILSESMAEGNFEDWRSLSSLLHVGWYLEQCERLDDLRLVVDRLKALWPQALPTRQMQAKLLQIEQRHDEATTVLREILEEAPGHVSARSALLESGAGSLTLDDLALPEDLLEDPFEVFGHDLESLGFLEELRLSPEETDTLQRDVVTLYMSSSLVLQGLDRELMRYRRIIQPLSKLGLAEARVHRIYFHPSQGVPILKSARVLQENGTLIETPHSEVIIRAPEDAQADVSDRREMVITLRGVEEGSLVDVVYDQRTSTYLSGGWSNIHYFGDGNPVTEEVLELALNSELPIHARVYGDSLPIEENDGQVRRWRMRNIKPLELDEFDPFVLDVASRVAMTTFNDWSEAGETYSRKFWPEVQVSGTVKQKARDLVKGKRSDKARFETIYRFIIEEIEGLAVELGAGGVVPSPAPSVLERSWGDCKDSSVLLIAMLEAVDIEARPVLLSTWGNVSTLEDFPNLSSFNHMIVQVTGLRGDPYVDPINGAPCPEILPSGSSGLLALHINRDGSSELIRTREAKAEDNGYELVVDMMPEDETTLRYDLEALYWGGPADFMKTAALFGDEEIIKHFLDSSTGYGVPAAAKIVSWNLDEDSCGKLKVNLSYTDSTFAATGAHSADLYHLTEATTYWGVPDSDPRVRNTHLTAPYTADITLRFHQGAGWIPDTDVAPFSFKSEYHEGDLKAKSKRSDKGRMLEVRETYSLKQRILPPEGFLNYRNKAIGMLVHAAQPYSYRKEFDEGDLEKVRHYVKENPRDQGFIRTKAMEVLGADVGGRGEAGRKRRALVREMLAPLLDSGAANNTMITLAVAVETMDKRFLAAELLVDKGLQRFPDDMWLIFQSSLVKGELCRTDEQLEALSALSQLTGDVGISFSLITELKKHGREDEVQRELARMELMGASPDSLQMSGLQLNVLQYQGRHEEALAYLDSVGYLFEKLQLRFRADILMELGKWEKATELLEEYHDEFPVDSGTCNNLAWCYAISGQQLDRALELAEAAAILSVDDSNSRNTLGSVLARLGRWKEARDLFDDLYQGDDRPNERLVNGYFLGLCLWALGDEDEALEMWNEIDGDEGCLGKVWIERLEHSRELALNGQDPSLAVFENLTP